MSQLTVNRYLLIEYYLAELILNDSVSSRRAVLQRAQGAYERYLTFLDTYRMLSKSDRRLYERYIEDRDQFSLVSSNDPSARRDTKIARYKQEKELKLKLEVCHGARRPGTSILTSWSSSQESH